MSDLAWTIFNSAYPCKAVSIGSWQWATASLPPLVKSQQPTLLIRPIV